MKQISSKCEKDKRLHMRDVCAKTQNSLSQILGVLGIARRKLKSDVFLVPLP